MTEREEKIAAILRQVLSDYNGDACTVNGYGCEGLCLNKESDEWVVATTAHNHIVSTDARFAKMIDACRFLLDQCFSSCAEAAEAKEYFFTLLRKNVPDFIKEY